MGWEIVAAILGSVTIVVGGVVKIMTSKQAGSDCKKQVDDLELSYNAFKSHMYEDLRDHETRLTRLEANYSSVLDKLDGVQKSIDKLEAEFKQEIKNLTTIIMESIKK